MNDGNIKEKNLRKFLGSGATWTRPRVFSTVQSQEYIFRRYLIESYTYKKQRLRLITWLKIFMSDLQNSFFAVLQTLYVLITKSQLDVSVTQT